MCHGVFEHWLHPAKYRTTLCQAETSCNRPICFFAHTLKELRPETKYNWCYVYRYPLYIQSYLDIMIENSPNGNWMIIPCNPHLQPPPPDQCYDNTTFGLGNCSNPQRIPLKICQHLSCLLLLLLLLPHLLNLIQSLFIGYIMKVNFHFFPPTTQS